MSEIKPWQYILFGLLCGFLFSALILFISTRSIGSPLKLMPAPTPTPITVYIIGSINTPGVYKLPQGSRLQDLITSAGGLSSDADPEAINLAKTLDDEEKIIVPARASGQKQSDTVESNGFPININTASKEELMLLPSIGETRADEIIAYREKQGSFTNIDQIMNVPGIGTDTYQKIQELIITE